MCLQTLAILFLGFLVTSAEPTLDSTLLAPSSSQQFGVQFQRLMGRVYAERSYDAIYWQRRASAHCMEENLQLYFSQPFAVSDGALNIRWKLNYNNKLLAVLCLNSTSDSAMLLRLADNLQHMRSARVLVIVGAALQRTTAPSLRAFFELCEQLKLLNVNLFHADFALTQLYHSYTQFPDVELETHHLSADRPLFPIRWRNMHQRVLLTMPDQIEPRTMLYTDARTGRQRMSGYMGKFMHAFADYYNCSLQQPYPYNASNAHVFYAMDVRDFAHNGTIDIGVSVSMPRLHSDLSGFSYPVEIIQWQLMVPVRSAMPLDVLLHSVFCTKFFLIFMLQYALLSLLTVLLEARVARTRRPHVADLVCNSTTLRGLLGQSFVMRRSPTFAVKYIYLLIFLAGLLFCTYFSAFYFQLLTVPPIQRPPASYDDALAQGLRVRVAENEVETFKNFNGALWWEKYQSLFVVLKTYDEFQQYRRSMALPYAYPITSSLWPVMAERQRFFASTIYLRSEIYISKFILVSLPIHENSIYREPLNYLIRLVSETGLFNHWFHMTFYDMAWLKRISFEDISTKRTYQPLKLTDFNWIWSFLALAIGSCVVVFLLEVFVCKFQYQRIFRAVDNFFLN